ncbi:MAG: ABC transporter permease [bacterium]
MWFLESIKSAISCLLANKGRLTLGVISISIGVATLMGAMVISESRKVFLKREIEKLGTNLMNVFTETRHRQFLTDKDVEMIKHCQGVLNVAGCAGGGGHQVQYFNKILDNVWVIGWEPQLREMINLSLKHGRFFTHQEEESQCNVGVIGNDLAYNLFGNKNPVGETIFIVVRGRKVPIRIIGVLKEIGIFQWYMAVVENNGIILPLTYIRGKILAKSWQGILRHIMVQTISTSAIKTAVKQIKKTFALQRNYSCDVITQQEVINYEYKLLKRTTMIGLCIATIFLIVGGIGIMSIMLKSVLERTREIGIRKAVGAKNRDILIQFLIEAFIIGILGCLVGILIGISGSYLISNWLIKTTTVIISLQTIFISSGVAIGLTLLFGLYPALRASSLNPIDALRYE